VATAPEPVDFFAEVRPLARELALCLIRQELVGLCVGLDGSGPAEGMALNGQRSLATPTDAAAASPGPPESLTRPCGLCGRDLPPSAFDPGRRQCRDCRKRKQADWGRKRREAAEADDERGLARA
jgi:hypothetical protein